VIDCSLSVGSEGGGGIVVYEKSFQGMNHLIMTNNVDPAASLRDSSKKTKFKYVRCSSSVAPRRLLPPYVPQPCRRIVRTLLWKFPVR
jgi:hypothetical protein